MAPSSILQRSQLSRMITAIRPGNLREAERLANPTLGRRARGAGSRALAVAPETLHSLEMLAATSPVAERETLPAHCNQSGLNGLAACATTGLDTGAFTVRASMPVNYAVEEVESLFSLDNEALLRGVIPGSFPSSLAPWPCREQGQRRFIVIDDNVHRIYGQMIEHYFRHHGIELRMLVLPTCEANKDFELVFAISRALEAFKINRRKEPIIAIGGGVCLDVAGLAANLFRRNTPVIKVPTTLMAAIDASIGIKTAVNFDNKKNKLGTYCPPLAVFIDRAFLRTLDGRNLSNGLAEMLKMACVKDGQLFGLLEAHASQLVAEKMQGPAAGQAMRRSIQGMLEELEYNLWEHVLCRLVDYGHTFSMEIEMAALASGQELLHGEAVNIDMALTTHLAAARGLISAAQRDRVIGVMRALRLPFWHPVCSPQLFIKGLADTTVARDGFQRLPLMNGIGSAVFVNDVTPDEVVAAAAALRATAMEEVNGLNPLGSLNPSWACHIAEGMNNVVAVPARPTTEVATAASV